MGLVSGIKNILSAGASSAMSEADFLEAEIQRWRASTIRQDQIAGERYYMGMHDILERTRTAIGAAGSVVEVTNIPNNRIVDNQYALRVDQKTNYLVGKPFTLKSDDDALALKLKGVFNKAFHRKLKTICNYCLNGGIGYLFLYYSEGELSFKIFPAYEILPFWSDREHTRLDSFVRMYPVEVYEGKSLKRIDKVEYYTLEGVKNYEIKDRKLRADSEKPEISPYMQADIEGEVKAFNWERIPLIPFRYNESEIPLINKVKSLQDGINLMLSTFQNNMEEDSRNTILVLVNYEGENLGEFRRNLATYGAIKVANRTDRTGGDVKTLQVEVNAENYKAILTLFKKALIENAKGFDSKDERLMGTPNEMNIQSIYNDIDLDANGMETEFQAAFEDLLWFVDAHFANTGQGGLNPSDVEIIFNRDALINKSTLIDNLVKSEGLLSRKTLLSHHPLVNDVEEEMRRIAEEGAEKKDDTEQVEKDDGGVGE